MQTKNHRVRFLELASTIGSWEKSQGIVCVDKEMNISYYSSGINAISDALKIGYDVMEGRSVYLSLKPSVDDIENLYKLGCSEVCYLKSNKVFSKKELYAQIPEHIFNEAELREDIKLYKMALFYDDKDENIKLVCCDLEDEMHNAPGFESYINDKWEIVNFTAIKEQCKNRRKLRDLSGFNIKYRIGLIRNGNDQSISPVIISSASSYESIKQSNNFIKFLTEWEEVKI
jgi:hypothetical protein